MTQPVYPQQHNPHAQLARGLAGYEPTPTLASIAIHGAILALLLYLGTARPAQEALREATAVVTPLSRYLPHPLRGTGGGSGGLHDQAPPTQGKLPRPAPRPFVPPTTTTVEHPLLPLEPVIVAPSDANLPTSHLTNFGDPLAALASRSPGPGSRGGIGTRDGGGIGPGSGPGYGPGDQSAARPGTPGVTAPSLLYQIEPEYSEDARKAKLQGTVRLSIIVDPSGRPRDIRVVRPLGLGLDERAIEAVTKWRFKPGQKDGSPIPVRATVEVNFRLL